MGAVTVSSIFASGFRISTTSTVIRAISFSLASPLPNHKTISIIFDGRWSNSNKRSFTSACSSHCVSSSSIDSNSTKGHFYTRLLPCPETNSAPRIEHLVVTRESTLQDYICKALDLPTMFVADLIEFGAVHYALVCPQPPPTASPSDFKTFKHYTSPSFLKNRASIRHKTLRDAQKTHRLTNPHQTLEVGTYLRVHVHPKRFPICYKIDWKSRILSVTNSFIVLDKPAGVSVGGTTDNIVESCVTFVSRSLNLPYPLKTTHQIDNCTEGCVVLARNSDYCSIFHKKLMEREVQKEYKALSVARVAEGVMRHYMKPGKFAPKIVSSNYVEGWHKCELEVVECREVRWPEAAAMERNCVDGGGRKGEQAYECRVRLITGKTHQIRAQLAACGAPLVGDTMYVAAVEAAGGRRWEEMGVDEWMAMHGKEPKGGIGLQASGISWDEGLYAYQAGLPWWASHHLS